MPLRVHTVANPIASFLKHIVPALNLFVPYSVTLFEIHFIYSCAPVTLHFHWELCPSLHCRMQWKNQCHSPLILSLFLSFIQIAAFFIFWWCWSCRTAGQNGVIIIFTVQEWGGVIVLMTMQKKTIDHRFSKNKPYFNLVYQKNSSPKLVQSQGFCPQKQP